MIIEYSNREILFKIQWNLYIFVVILRNYRREWLVSLYYVIFNHKCLIKLPNYIYIERLI